MSSSKTPKSNSPTPLDSTTVKQLADILNETNLTEIEYELGDAKIRVARQVQHVQSVQHVQAAPAQSGAMPSAPMPANAAQDIPASHDTAPADISKHPGLVKSPMVGNAYLSPAPGADPFIAEGDSVKAGDSILIIEAMKVMNQIKAHKDGVIKQIMVTDGDPVEFDEPLVIIE